MGAAVRAVQPERSAAGTAGAAFSAPAARAPRSTYSTRSTHSTRRSVRESHDHFFPHFRAPKFRFSKQKSTTSAKSSKTIFIFDRTVRGGLGRSTRKIEVAAAQRATTGGWTYPSLELPASFLRFAPTPFHVCQQRLRCLQFSRKLCCDSVILK